VGVGNRIVNWPLYTELHITSLTDNAICKKCGHKEESSYHMLCQCPHLAAHRMKFFGSVWVELIDISKTSARF
jgi:Zn finger protein HypA/HybF involved in hydrogenase expression